MADALDISDDKLDDANLIYPTPLTDLNLQKAILVMLTEIRDILKDKL